MTPHLLTDYNSEVVVYQIFGSLGLFKLTTSDIFNICQALLGKRYHYLLPTVNSEGYKWSPWKSVQYFSIFLITVSLKATDGQTQLILLKLELPIKIIDYRNCIAFMEMIKLLKMEHHSVSNPF